MKNIIKIGTLAFIASAILAPMTANAQDWRREQTANEWKTIATISGALGLLGRLNHDNTLAFAGAAGTLYSAYRYEEDLKSIDRYNRTRADYFGRDYFYRDGCRYERRVVWQHGQKYYQFVNCDYESRNRGSDWYNTRSRYNDDEWRREDDRRIADERRQEEQQRREDQRRRDEERREEARWRDEERRREDARRREQERWDRDHRNGRSHDNGNRGNSRGNDRGDDRRDDRRDNGHGND